MVVMCVGVDTHVYPRAGYYIIRDDGRGCIYTFWAHKVGYYFIGFLLFL